MGQLEAVKFASLLDLDDPVEELYLQCNEVFYEREALSDLSSEAAVVYLVQLFDRELSNGGIDQFFYNSSGFYTFETLTALQRIGASISASILEEGIRLIDLSEAEMKLRMKRFEAVKQKDLKTIFALLDSKFYNTVHSGETQPPEPQNLWFLCHKLMKCNQTTTVRAQKAV
ncbi:MAG: hypothetical protein C0507_25470 [Cyanobacteria bacterium PR.3.49]|nr:hypothetical protein [Cyanobacteria bacterium PR.3.49]